MKYINTLLVLLSVIYIAFSENNQDCISVTSPETTCYLNHDQNLTLQDVLNVVSNSNISKIWFYERSNDDSGNRFLKDNYVAIAEEMNKYTHITDVHIRFFVTSEELEADFIKFINLIERDGLVRNVYIKFEGGYKDISKFINTIDFTTPISSIEMVSNQSLAFSSLAITQEEYDDLLNMISEIFYISGGPSIKIGQVQGWSPLQKGESFIYNIMPPHMPETDEYLLHFVLQSLEILSRIPEQNMDRQQAFEKYDYSTGRYTNYFWIDVLMNEDGDQKYLTYDYNVGSTSSTPFQQQYFNLLDKVAYNGHKIYLCENGYEPTLTDGKYTFSCKNSEPPVKNQIQTTDCTGDKTEKHVTVNSGSNCFKQSTFQECYRYMGQLQDPVLSADQSYKEVDTVCTTSTWNSEPTIKVSLTYTNWKLSTFNIPDSSTNKTPYAGDISDCGFSRKLYASSECNYGEEQCNTKNDGNFKQLGIEWGQDSNINNQDVDDTTEKFDHVYSSSLDSYFIHLKLSDLASGNISYCKENTVLSDSTGDFVFQCFFAEDILMYGVPQHTYAFDVQVTIDRDTSASKSLDVTKTLVQGNCCKNSFGIESQLHFCESTATCEKGVSDIQTIQRNQPFIAVWQILEDAQSAAIKSFAFLFPDTIKIGPFLPDWQGYIDDTGRSADSEHWLTPSDASSFAIQLQSNVAFQASVTITGRIWEKSQFGPGVGYPHTCFIKEGENDPSGCSAFVAPTSRRVLQSSDPEYGSPESQMQVSSSIVFSEGENNDKQNKKSNSSKKDDDNTVLIAVIVSIVGVLVIGGIIAAVYFTKSKSKKYQTEEKGEKQHVKEIIA